MNINTNIVENVHHDYFSSSMSGGALGTEISPQIQKNFIKSAHFGAFWDDFIHLAPLKHSKPLSENNLGHARVQYHFLTFFCLNIYMGTVYQPSYISYWVLWGKMPAFKCPGGGGGNSDLSWTGMCRSSLKTHTHL